MGSKISPPTFRKLRGYAIDPSLNATLSTMAINDLTYKVDWEELEKRGNGQPGSYPIGEYVEIVDFDPPSGLFYAPVNMDDPYLLAQDGCVPSVGNPQFHQQMVYAVIMTTIKNFERALGRKVMWAENMLNIKDEKDDAKTSSKPTDSVKRTKVRFEFVQRLRVYPHALRQANAYYDPNMKALLFGYFNAAPVNPQLHIPGGTVFTCLSHDIIAHETTHAILDGFHRRYIDPTHPDTRAFHEAFSDLVALLQHFSFPEVLKHQIAVTRGDLTKQNLLGQLAQQFGKAIGSYGSLRDAIGRMSDDGVWEPQIPNPQEYATVMDTHARGSILVATVFDAFLNIYRSRAMVFVRIATGGSGILPEGELACGLVDLLADTAAKTASHVLRICIRALDYCPPIDITFGDYLRALITADMDMVADDTLGYRVAFIEAFQNRGIYAEGLKSMSQEELAYEQSPDGLDSGKMEALATFLRKIKETLGYESDRKNLYEHTKEFIRGKEGLHKKILDDLVESGPRNAFSFLSGLMFPRDEETSEKEHGLEWGYLSSNAASFAIGNLRIANRASPEGGFTNHMIITLHQKRGVRFKVEDDNAEVDENGYFVPDKTERKDWGEHHIIFRGGCTLIFDLETLKLRYAIKKDIDDKDRMIRQFRYEYQMGKGRAQTYFDEKTLTALAGPIACIHSNSLQH
jgi:hypothetical protein